MNEKNEVKWCGSPNPKCDFCHDELKGLDFFVDGKTHPRGQWGLMCPEDFERYGMGLGTGRGQKYDGKTFIKVEG